MSWKRRSNCAKSLIKFYSRTMKDSGLFSGLKCLVRALLLVTLCHHERSDSVEPFVSSPPQCQGLVTLSGDGSLKSRRTDATRLSSPWLWQNPLWNQMDYLQCELHFKLLRLPENRPRCCLGGRHNQQKLRKPGVSMATTLHRAWPTKCSMNAKDLDRGEKQHF